jgi:hypothetical protein
VARPAQVTMRTSRPPCMQEPQPELGPGLRDQPGPASEPSAGTATAEPASPVKPKWAALLEPAGPIAPAATGQGPTPVAGLGKTQAGNILASLASQPVPALQAPAPPAGARTSPVAASAAMVTSAPPAASSPQKDPQQQPSAAAANAGPAGGASDNGAGEPDPSKDDILPSKPRASLRLRPSFRLPTIGLPGFRLR